MASARVHIGPTHGRKIQWLRYLLIACLALGLGYTTAQTLLVGIGVVGGVIGLVLVAACALDPGVGLVINLFYAFTAYHWSRWLAHDQFPVGVISDGITYALFFGFLVRGAPLKDTFRSFLRSPIVIAALLFLGLCMIEAFNPNTHSPAGWFLAMRKDIVFNLLFFVAYDVFKDKTQVRRFIRFTFYATLMAALYGCLQQMVGLFPFERSWVIADDIRFGLICINGEFRKFSLFSGPTEYGMLMGAASVFFLVLSMRETGRRAWLMRLAIIPMLMGMSFSGTRTANFMVVAGIGMFILLTINRRSSQVLAAVVGVTIAVLLFIPIYGDPTLNRFRTTFDMSNDASYLLRDQERHYLQPYMWTHPIGGGLCSSGNAGLLYNPGNYLAGVQTDNNYLLIGLELGWIGLTLVCLSYFFVLRTSIRAYFMVKNPREKILAAAALCFIFTYYVACYTQEALGSIMDIAVYYPLIAIMIRMTESESPLSKTPQNA